ncbi:MAG: tetratricopeptide repeat protein, partial [Anaerosomatales bacterium]
MQVGTESSVAAAPRRQPFDQALAVISAVLLIAVLSAAAFLVYSVVQGRAIEQGATPRARLISDLHAQIDESPNDAALRVRLGEVYAAAGQHREAVRELNVALELNPDHTGAYLVLGMVALMQKDYDSADTYFNKILELTEGSEFKNLQLNRELAFYYLGESALDTSRYEDAVGYFKAVIRMNRGSADAYFGLGLAFKGIEDYLAALDNFEIALAFDPTFAQAHYEMGQVYLAEEDRINAAVHFAQAALLAPDSDLPAEALASLGTVEEWETKAREA